LKKDVARDFFPQTPSPGRTTVLISPINSPSLLRICPGPAVETTCAVLPSGKNLPELSTVYSGEHVVRRTLSSRNEQGNVPTETVYGGKSGHVYCLLKVSGPVFVTVPNSPLDVMSVVPANEVPLILP